ncbi:hypothetical protein [Deinococcus peraridilitoris]|uniref:Uncharacterized protein n=1 Tax=Deinococcus peraridilitoris (strain DSM 19664 / LMG 22246 / CIP 109416 / KR-200) TaxID=937777 RepID=L0A0W9_DEIPD|nr:hypothetical protein [Deinococcus peraridilitoris]AFZ67543.1 hypothetical protein Deipe_2047 [Deinococcus peraridilitoris DSM 19664]
MQHTPTIHARSTVPGVKTGWAYRAHFIDQWGNHGTYDTSYGSHPSLAAACAAIDEKLDTPSTKQLRVLALQETRGNRSGHRASTLRTQEVTKGRTA